MATIVPKISTKAQWLCNLPDRDPSDLGLRMTAQILFTPSFRTKRPLSEEEFAEVQETVAKGLAKLREGRRWDHKIVSAVTYLEPVHSGGIKAGGGLRQGWLRERKEVFIGEAMRILLLAGDRLRVCCGPDCGKVIYAVKRQEYCGACAKKIRKQSIAEWRAAHPE